MKLFNKKMNAFAIIVLAGAVISAFGAYLATRQQDADNELNQKELKKRDDEIKSKSDKIILLQEKQNSDLQEQLTQTREIAELNRKIAEAQTELRHKSDQVAALTEHNNSLITGGESFCYAYLDFENVNDRTGNKDAAVYVIHEGEFPLYSISMTIVEVGVIEMFSSGASVEYRNSKEFFESMAIQKMMASQSFKVGDLGTNKAKLLGEINLSGEENLKIEIKFSSPRNGSWSQIAFIERKIDKNGKSKVIKNTYRIEKYIQKSNGDGFTLIKEASPSSFPYRNKELIEPWLN